MMTNEREINYLNYLHNRKWSLYSKTFSWKDYDVNRTISMKISIQGILWNDVAP